MNELLLLLHKKVIYSLFNSQFNSILFYRLDQGAIPGIPLHTVHVLPAKQDSPDHHFSSDQLSLHLDNLRKDPQGIALITSENLLGCIVSIQKKTYLIEFTSPKTLFNFQEFGEKQLLRLHTDIQAYTYALANILSREHLIKDMIELCFDAMTNALILLHPETHDHSKRVQLIGKLLLKKLLEQDFKGVRQLENEKEVELLQYVGMEMASLTFLLHDYGKLTSMGGILHSKKSLTREDKIIVTKHPLDGCKAIEKLIDTHKRDPMLTEILILAKTVCLNHHEHYDGTGYPNSKRGGDIPLLAQIATVADVYDALLFPRSYNKISLPKEEMIKEMLSLFGGKFNPTLKPYFEECLSEINEILGKHSEKQFSLSPSSTYP